MFERYSWVEIQNRSAEPVSLKGYYLSNDTTQAAKWAFPDRTIAPGECLIVYLSGKNLRDGELHTSFEMQAKDKTILLVNMAEMRLDVIPLEMGVPIDMSCGRNGTAKYQYFMPTPGEPNTQLGLEYYKNMPINPSPISPG